MRRLSTILLTATLLFSDCFPPGGEREKAPENVEAYVPVYVASKELGDIMAEAPREAVSPGKIYATPRYIFQNDIQHGIHVIDRTTVPVKKIAFIRIPFSTELAVRENILYTNYISDLITVDISGLTAITPDTPPLKLRLVSRIRDVFLPVNQRYPPFSGYFVCPDKSNGFIAYWDLQKVKKATCQR